MSLQHPPEIQDISSNIEQTSVDRHSESIGTTAIEPAVQTERLILESRLENLDDREKVMRCVQAVEDISQAPEHQ